MISEQQQNSITGWFRESILIKLMLIGVLTLLLLIPANMIESLIWERQERQKEVVNEITDKWSGSQLLEGPILVLPYKMQIQQKDNSGKVILKDKVASIYILPEELNISGSAAPETKKRGIYNTVVYNSNVRVNGRFSALETKKSGINPEMILWDKAKVVIGLSDLKGLKNNPVIKIENSSYNVETDFSSIKLFSNNLSVQADLSGTRNTALSFNFDLAYRGSNELNFLHLGKTTSVNISSSWGNPSFSGSYLPDNSKIDKSEFSANWKLPYFNRPFPQQWTEDASILSMKNSEASFGVKFLLPVDQYQKTMRTAKYAILIILLTFVSLFFTELLNKKRVHLLQYILIGAAMSIYYTLLLSFSEQVGFNVAYLIASLATVGLVSIFIASVLKSSKAAFLFAGILTIFYTFIFVIIQLQDLALLFGSIGLFIIVAALMYLSAQVDWEKKRMAASV